MLTVEVIPNFSAVQSRTDDSGRARHKQVVFVNVGGAYPLQVTVPVDTPHGYLPGTYKMAAESFRVGKYGDLEINNYGVVLHPDKSGEIKKAV